MQCCQVPQGVRKVMPHKSPFLIREECSKGSELLQWLPIWSKWWWLWLQWLWPQKHNMQGRWHEGVFAVLSEWENEMDRMNILTHPPRKVFSWDSFPFVASFHSFCKDIFESATEILDLSQDSSHLLQDLFLFVARPIDFSQAFWKCDIGPSTEHHCGTWDHARQSNEWGALPCSTFNNNWCVVGLTILFDPPRIATDFQTTAVLSKWLLTEPLTQCPKCDTMSKSRNSQLVCSFASHFFCLLALCPCVSFWMCQTVPHLQNLHSSIGQNTLSFCQCQFSVRSKDPNQFAHNWKGCHCFSGSTNQWRKEHREEGGFCANPSIGIKFVQNPEVLSQILS